MRGVEHIPWIYDGFFWFYERIGFRRWRTWLARDAAGRTLEIGVGTGRNLPLYRADARVVGLEPDHRALQAARRRAPGVPLVAGSAEALPFRTGCFDTVVSGMVFCSVDEPATGLQEVRRVLAAAGTLRMIEHVRGTGWTAWLLDRVQPVWTWFAGGCRPNRDTERTVEQAGFRIETAGRRARGKMRRFVARPGPGAP